MGRKYEHDRDALKLCLSHSLSHCICLFTLLSSLLSLTFFFFFFLAVVPALLLTCVVQDGGGGAVDVRPARLGGKEAHLLSPCLANGPGRPLPPPLPLRAAWWLQIQHPDHVQPLCPEAHHHHHQTQEQKGKQKRTKRNREH